MVKLDNNKEARSKLFYTALVIFIAFVSLFVLASIKELLIPIFVGGILAYVCKPLLQNSYLKRMPKVLRYFIMTVFAFGFLGFLFIQFKNIIPSKKEQLELSIRLQYKVNEKFDLLFKNQTSIIIKSIASEVEPLKNRLNEILMLSDSDILEYEAYYSKSSKSDLEKRIYKYYQHNLKNHYIPSRDPASENFNTFRQFNINLSKIYSSISVWLITPFIFLFLLFDRGKIKRYFIALVPNRYFELSLTLVYRVDKAIGSYLRGTVLQCSLVGLTLFVCFVLVGFSWQAALFISLLSAIANAIPFLGPIIGLSIGLTYALIAENVYPILPFFSQDNLFWGVIFSVLVAQVLDNIYFQPIVLGSAVRLHPLIVVIGVMAGASIYGIFGMLIAIPTIVIIKAIIETLITELRAYKII